jgi:hypothetical protein
MDYGDWDEVDDAVLALLWLTSFEDHDSHRAWKSHDWDALERLHQKGFISNPRSKAKSVVLTDDGTARSCDLSERTFGRSSQSRLGVCADGRWLRLAETRRPLSARPTHRSLRKPPPFRAFSA